MLQRLLGADASACKLIREEIAFLEQLSGHANIIEYLGTSISAENAAQGQTEFLLLTELCTGMSNVMPAINFQSVY